MQDMAKVAEGEDSNTIFDGFRDFVRVHQALLNILIGKSGLFQTVPFIGQPIAAVLRQVDGVTDVSSNWPLTPLFCRISSSTRTLIASF